MDLYGGIDLGGTFIKAAAVDAAGTIRGRAKVPTAVREGRSPVLQRMSAALREAAEQAGGDLIAAGVGVPGLVSDDGIILKFPNFPGWDGFDLRAAVRENLGLPVAIENDANAAAVAEQVAGSAGGRPHYIFVTLGTGIGGGIILDGRLFRGRHGKAAELGHLKVVPGGRLCGCGARGCVEQYASGKALTRDARMAVDEGRLPPPNGNTAISPRWLHQLAASGQPEALALYHWAAQHLGIALAAAVGLMDISQFFIGGGVAGAFDILRQPLRESILAHAFGLSADDLALSAATCGSDAGMIGAAYLGRQALAEHSP
ncbi:MAG: ROK family protein [Acidobacteriota bacterium]